MKIEKFKEPVTKRYKWSADFTYIHTRRRLVADSTKKPYDEIDLVKRKARQRKLGLEVEREMVMLGTLVKERVEEFDKRKKNHRRAIIILEDF